jgi:hypothetical protein
MDGIAAVIITLKQLEKALFSCLESHWGQEYSLFGSRIIRSSVHRKKMVDLNVNFIYLN